MISSTITIPHVQPPSVIVHLKVTQEDKIRSLLDRMKNGCQGLPHPQGAEVMKALEDWELQFFQKFVMDSPLDHERMKAVYAVCFLYFNIVEYALLKVAVSQEEKLLWFKLYNELRSRLTEILPAGKDIDQLLATYIQRQKQKRYLPEIARVAAFFQKIEDDLFAHANQSNQGLIDGFETLKIKLLVVHAESEFDTEQVHNSLNALTANVNKLYQEFGQQINEMKAIENQMKLQERMGEHNIHYTEKLINHLKT